MEIELVVGESFSFEYRRGFHNIPWALMIVARVCRPNITYPDIPVRDFKSNVPSYLSVHSVSRRAARRLKFILYEDITYSAGFSVANTNEKQISWKVLKNWKKRKRKVYLSKLWQKKKVFFFFKRVYYSVVRWSFIHLIRRGSLYVNSSPLECIYEEK